MGVAAPFVFLMKKSLPDSEWLFLGLFFLLFVAFILVAKVNVYRASLALRELKEEEEIKVIVVGEVEQPVEVVLPKGSRICDLKNQIIFTKETNKAFFRRKKLLQNGEKITVPKKAVE